LIHHRNKVLVKNALEMKTQRIIPNLAEQTILERVKLFFFYIH